MKTSINLFFLSFYVFFFVLFLYLLSPSIIRAFVVNPNSGNLQIGTSQNIQIVASGVPTGANTAAIEINITGPCSITSFTKGASFDLELGTFTSTSISKSVGKTGAGSSISNGEVLATFTVLCNSAGTLTILRSSDSGYSGGGSGNTVSLSETTLATFSVSTQTPNTSIDFLDLSFLFGVFLLSIGILIYYRSKRVRLQKKYDDK